MTLSVPEDKWEELKALCESEGVEATVIGRFVPSGRLELKYHDNGRWPTFPWNFCTAAGRRSSARPYIAHRR